MDSYSHTKSIGNSHIIHEEMVLCYSWLVLLPESALCPTGKSPSISAGTTMDCSGGRSCPTGSTCNFNPTTGLRICCSNTGSSSTLEESAGNLSFNLYNLQFKTNVPPIAKHQSTPSRHRYVSVVDEVKYARLRLRASTRQQPGDMSAALVGSASNNTCSQV